MSQRDYSEVIAGYCELVGAEGAAEILQTGNLTVNDIPVSLVYESNMDREDILICCELGLLRTDDPEKEIRTLMQSNLVLYGGSIGGCLALKPHSDVVALLGYMKLADATPERLHMQLSIMAEVASMWRQGDPALFSPVAQILEPGGQGTDFQPGL